MLSGIVTSHLVSVCGSFNLIDKLAVCVCVCVGGWVCVGECVHERVRQGAHLSLEPLDMVLILVL
jgi:hypothetical protein